MESDAGAFMRIAIGIFFLAFGAGLSYLFFRLASAVGRLNRILSDVGEQIGPLLSRVEASLDGVNSELSKIDEITESVAEMIGVAEKTTTSIYSTVSKPVRQIAGLAAGLKEGISSFLSGKGKENS